MVEDLRAKTVNPLLEVASANPNINVRLQALDAVSRLPLNEEGWREVAGVCRRKIVDLPPGSPERKVALQFAVRIPLVSVRTGLRNMADNPTEPDARIVADELARARDPSQTLRILDQARAGNIQVFETLAGLPLEDYALSPNDIPRLGRQADPNIKLWRALALARIGEYRPLDVFMLGDVPEPDIFWGDPWTPYNLIATIRPIPTDMHDHLLSVMRSFKQEEDYVSYRWQTQVIGAATGIISAEGYPLEDDEGEYDRAIECPTIESGIEPSSAQVSRAEGAAVALLEPERGEVDFRVLAHLPPEQVAPFLMKFILSENRKSDGLPDPLAGLMHGNEIIDMASALPRVADWPVADLVQIHVTGKQTVLEDDQIAWIIARGMPDKTIREMINLLTTDRSIRELQKILDLIGRVGDHYAGRGGSPYRGAGPGAAEVRGPLVLIDDRPEEAAIGDVDELVDDAKIQDERRVNAQIHHNGRVRNTYVTGAENVIRCWIGLPDPDRAAVADESISPIHIPPEGLHLQVQLLWRDQSSTTNIVLPASRTARSGDCDLPIFVPEEVRYVSALILFRYRGSVFEAVEVEAYAVNPDEPEQEQHDVRVRVRMDRREVIELEDRNEVDTVFVFGEDRSLESSPETIGLFGLHGFGKNSARTYRIHDAQIAVPWLSKELFVTEKTLVRRREREDRPDADPALDQNDPEVIRIFRVLARHGADLYNVLSEQLLEDPGKRVQLVNLQPQTYVPIEFVYDKGYPREDAKLCVDGLKALATEEDECPTCKPTHEIIGEERSNARKICPFGFWSIRKIIERYDPDLDSRTSTPHSGRRALPLLERVLFASSHRVPEEERDKTWDVLGELFSNPTRAHNWAEWKGALETAHHPLLLVLPHHVVHDLEDSLEIGDEEGPVGKRLLARGQLIDQCVNPKNFEPGPIVVLLGCRTASESETGYINLARRFQQLKVSIVVGTLSKILGLHAAPVARELVAELIAVDNQETDFGTIMRRLRRRMLARGYLMSLCLVALGDAEWRLTPLP